VKLVVLLFLAVTIGPSLHAQVSGMLPGFARDSLEARDSKSPTALSERQRHLDSLAAGRSRWRSAGVRSYQLQAHSECFCINDDKAVLATVRNGRVVARTATQQHTGGGKMETVEDLFDQVERDLRDVGRVVEELALHPRYGFPVRYRAATPTISDLGISIRVDSFAVLSP
jgi:hypothetical protein